MSRSLLLLLLLSLAELRRGLAMLLLPAAEVVLDVARLSHNREADWASSGSDWSDEVSAHPSPPFLEWRVYGCRFLPTWKQGDPLTAH